MPLYLCEENWNIAKHIMKLTMGWAVTLEPAGFMYDQVQTVPFLILSKLAEMSYQKPDSNFLNFQFDLVKQTCIQIMKESSRKDFEKKLDENRLSLYENYITDTKLRTVDSIANNTVLLAQLYIIMESGLKLPKNEEYFEEFFKSLLEEELRRRTYPLNETVNRHIWSLELLNVDTNKYIRDPVDKFMKSRSNPHAETSGYEAKFLSMLSEKIEEKEEAEEEKILEPPKKEKEIKKIAETSKEEEEIKKNEEKPTMTKTNIEIVLKTDDQYNEKQKQAISELEKVFKMVINYLYPWYELISKRKVKEPLKISSWGIDNDWKLFTLYIQNKLQSKNVDRRSAFSDNKYLNPWTHAKEYIMNFVEKSVEEEKNKRINEILILEKDKSSGDKARVFAYATSLNEAAGALLGTRIGDGSIRSFVRVLCEGNAINIHEKIKMLASGHFKGVKLYSDLKSWNIGHLNRNRLSRAYPGQVFIY